MPSVAHAHRGGGASGVISPADMAFLREEEKLARDVYITLHDRWGLPIFDQIAVSEQLHTDSVRALLDRHDLYDPVLDDNVGVFTDPFLASLYDQLVNLGLTSEIDALVVGATIEDLDILDITEKLEHNDAADVTRVLERLRCGSHSHARGFVGALAQYGVVYTPQYTSQAEWDAILGNASADCPL